MMQIMVQVVRLDVIHILLLIIIETLLKYAINHKHADRSDCTGTKRSAMISTTRGTLP